MKEFKARASAAGVLLTNPKTETTYFLSGLEIDKKKYQGIINKAIKDKDFDVLSQLSTEKKYISDYQLSSTVETYLQEWLKEQIYGVRKEIKSKYLEKGTVMEAESIEKAIQWADLPFVIKNEDKFEDEFFTGTPDIIGDDFVVDTKCSWDCFSFPLFETEVPEKNYFAQLQVYMHLTGKRKAKLIYVLLNTPEYITWETPHDYSDIDTKHRIKVFEIDYDADFIADLQNRVLNTREYINNLKNVL